MAKVKRMVFDNGLVFLTERRPYTDEAVLLVGVKHGSRNETEENSGVTHFIEHMLFGTNKWRTRQEIAEDLEAAGTDIDAFTDQNMVAFRAETLPWEISNILPIIFEAVKNDRYDREEFERQKDEIGSEIRLYFDHPSENLFDHLFLPTLFEGTPLAKQIVGSAETVERMTMRKLLTAKREIFIPNKPMIVVVVGKFDEKELAGEIGKTFGTLPRGEKTEAGSPIVLENKKSRKLEERQGIKQAYFNLGFRTPSLSHRDSLKIGLISTILGEGFSSRLAKELRSKTGSGYVINSTYDSFGDIGCLYIYVTLKPEKIEETEEIIVAQFNDLKENLIGKEELERAKNLLLRKKNFLLRRYYSHLTGLESQALKLTMHEFEGLPLDFIQDLDSYVRRISAQGVRQAARRYLSDNYVVTALVPRG